MVKKYDTVEKVTLKVTELTTIANDSLAENDMRIRLSEGNSKLQGILNFSITPVLSCPYKTEACALACYAVKDYKRNRSNVAKSHTANWKMTQQVDFVNQMIATIERQLARKKYRDQHVEFRIHVSGDFYSYEYFAKWIAITDYFADRDISFGCYTKSIPFIKSYLKRNNRTLQSININFMSSVWNDTKPSLVAMTEELGMNIFTAYDGKSDLPEGYIACQDDIEEKACGRTCNLCYEKDPSKLLDDKWESILAEAFGRKKVAIAIH